jgi:hypothetical protein
LLFHHYGEKPHPIPNPNPPLDPYTKINQCLNELINLIGQIRNTREPYHISLATYLTTLLFPLAIHMANYLIDTKYRARMRGYYSTGH